MSTLDGRLGPVGGVRCHAPCVQLEQDAPGHVLIVGRVDIFDLAGVGVDAPLGFLAVVYLVGFHLGLHGGKPEVRSLERFPVRVLFILQEMWGADANVPYLGPFLFMGLGLVGKVTPGSDLGNQGDAG